MQSSVMEDPRHTMDGTHGELPSGRSESDVNQEVVMHQQDVEQGNKNLLK